MKSISRIQKYLTVATIAAVMGFGMLFISPAQPVHAQSPTQSALQEMINTLLAQIAVLQELLAQQQGGNDGSGNETPTVDTTGTSDGTISIGDTVRVQGTRLSVRSTPGGVRLGVAEPGATARVVGGPQALDGYIWWQLDYTSGVDGWSAADWLVVAAAGDTSATNGTGDTSTATGGTTTNTPTGSSNEIGTLTASVSGTDISISTRNGITKAAAQSFCNLSLNQWKFQYTILGYSPDRILCQWVGQNGGTWSQPGAVATTGQGTDSGDTNTTNTASDSNNSGSGNSGSTGNQNVTNLVVRAGEDLRYEFGPTGYRKTGVSVAGIVCNSNFGINHNVRLSGGQASLVVTTTEDARLQTCAYRVNIKNTRNNDAIVYEETVRVTVVAADASDDEVAEAEADAQEGATPTNPTSANHLGDYQVYIDRGSDGFTSIYQDLNVPKQDARDHCAQNMDGWLDRFASQYPGELIECLWDDGAGDTAGQRNRIPGGDTEGTTPATTNNRNTQLINHGFSCILGRPADDAGRGFYQLKLDGGLTPGGFFADMFNSSEYRGEAHSDSGFLNDLYRCVLFRSPDTAGKNFWMDYLDGGGDRSVVISDFLSSDDFTSIDVYSEL